jgi:CheY-like chemotaxis protein
MPGAASAVPGGLRLLAVEDQPANVALLHAVLARARDTPLRDARLSVAGSLAEARAFIVREAFDIVLLDVRLPDGDGLELARDLARAPERPRVVVLTANALPADEAAARAAGADAFIAKPYQPSALLATLRDLAPTDAGAAS